MNPLSVWNKEDLEAHRVLDDLLLRKASWDLTTPDAVRLYKSLVWFAQLRSKIEKSQAEIIGIRDLTPPAPVAEESQ
jgi:hypothetical protein